MKAPRRRLISVLAATATLMTGAATASVATAAPQAGETAPEAGEQRTGLPEAPADGIIVAYHNRTETEAANASASAAESDSAARAEATAKGKKTGQKLKFERRLATGAALYEVEGKTSRAEIDEIVEAFESDPDVAYAEPNTRVYAMATPNDTNYSSQWDLFESTAGMRVPGAWDRSTGQGTVVAVLDTGYVAHSDLAANIVSGYDFVSDATNARDGNGRDSNPADEGDWFNAGECGVSYDSPSSWHGTHVAGTIAAATNNGKGIAGVAYNAKIQPVRVLAKCGGTTADIADAITWASGGTVYGVPANPTPADVINMSLGGGGTCSSTYQNAINGAVGRGTTVVVAAGNSNANAANFTPASCNNVVTVASSDREGNRASYSNYGSVVDIAAPGGETATRTNGILSTVDSGSTRPAGETYAYYQGTSMAAPHIAGLAALVKSADSSLSPAQIEQLIKSNSRTLPGTCSGGCGAGLADAAATVAAAGGDSGGGGEQPPAGDTYTNGTNVAIPDSNTTGVTSPIAVSGRSGNAPADLQVAVDIKHTYRGDLVVELVAPDGRYATLKQSSASDSADNVIATYTVDASSVLANGTWKLRVKDVYSGDTGYIDSWSLTF
ncbi:serine protease [Streptomyces radiopugnans]|uniref:Serine protease n=2 Tax=Streptomyces radiopugnans TaxID=403935 RepID=A0A1H9CV01_9ACTN|nr:serine protease [Streptomyces radiopugnans]